MASHLKPQLHITLYRGWPGSGTYVWSPFVTKLEARLRFAGLSYRTEAGSVPKAPRGKIPYVSITKTEPGSQTPGPPTTIPDSTLIVKKLVEDGVLEDLNAKLSPTEKAHDLAIRALLEDKLYFYQNNERWVENYYIMRPHVLGALPYPIQLLIGLLAYRKVTQTLYGQGTGRLPLEEISRLRQQVWESVDALLVAARRKKTETDAGDATFWVLGGNGPSEADTVLFGFISSALVCTAGPESRKVVKSFPVLEDYARRIHDRYFPDYACWE